MPRCVGVKAASGPQLKCQPAHAVPGLLVHERLLATPTRRQSKRAGLQLGEQQTNIRELVSRLRDCDSTILLNVLTQLSQCVTVTVNPPVDAIVAADGVEALVAVLKGKNTCVVYLEAAKTLSCIAAGTPCQAAAVVDAGCVDALYKILSSDAVLERPELCDQLLQLLGNIAGQNAALRDEVLMSDVMEVLAKLYVEIPQQPWQQYYTLQALRTFTWLMSNLCQCEPRPQVADVEGAFHYFAQVLLGSDDSQMLCEASTGLAHFFHASMDQIEFVDYVKELLLIWEISGSDLQTAINQHVAVQRIKSCANLLEESGSPTPAYLLRLLQDAPRHMAASSAANKTEEKVRNDRCSNKRSGSCPPTSTRRVANTPDKAMQLIAQTLRVDVDDDLKNALHEVKRVAPKNATRDDSAKEVQPCEVSCEQKALLLKALDARREAAEEAAFQNASNLLDSWFTDQQASGSETQ